MFKTIKIGNTEGMNTKGFLGCFDVVEEIHEGDCIITAVNYFEYN